MRSLLRLTGTALFLATLVWSQQAPDKKPAAPPDPCASAQSQMEITNCWEDQAQKANTRLAALYQKVQTAIKAKMAEEEGPLKGYREQALTKLRAAQLAWTHYRDAQCDAEEQQYEGGTVAPSVHAGCLKELADQRIGALQKTYAIYLLSK